MAIVKKYPVRVVAIQNHTPGVYTLELVSLGGTFKYNPGQFLHLSLEEYDPSQQWPDSRCFSMQSVPGQTAIKITYAVKGVFTSEMEKNLQLGSEITIKLPYGDLFTQPHSKKDTIFISGGTGITPFLSLLNHSSFAEYSDPVLYAGFRDRSMNFYGSELETAKMINPQFRFIPVYQDEAGILDISKIQESSQPSASFFISGPPLMIKTFKSELIRKGVKSDQIKTDDWE